MIRRNKLTSDQWQAIIEARKAGATIAQLQERFGVSTGVARDVSQNYDALAAREAAKCIYPRVARWMVEHRATWKVLILDTGLRYNTLRDILYGRTRCPKPETLETIANAMGMAAAEAFYKEENHEK